MISNFFNNINRYKPDNLLEKDGNNFKSIRLILSVLVVHTHAYLLLEGNMSNDPIKKIFNIKWGDLGTTTLFFIISGFLIYKSLSKDTNILGFVKNRIVKLIPAIIVANIFFILVGYLCVNYSFFDYFFSKNVFYFLYRNIIILDVRPRIGFGLFEHNIVPALVNPQWWTLPWNFKMYAVSIFIFSLPKIIRHPVFFNIFYFVLLIFLSVSELKFGWWNQLLACFITGIFFFINKEKIFFHLMYFLIALILLFILYKTNWYLFLSIPIKGYLLFYFAFVNIKNHRLIKKFPELSYGIFLYHMFIQQLLIYFGVSNVNFLFVLSCCISFLISFLSLKFVELPIQNFFNYKLNFTSNSC